MKKLDLSQTLGLLANAGVIAGIVFLAIELRQNNDQLAVQIALFRHDIRTNDIRSFSAEPELAEAQVKLRRNEEISDVMHERLFWAYAVRFTNYELNYLLQGEDFPNFGMVANFRRDPYLMVFWREHRDFLDPEFVRWMEGEVFSQLE